MKDSLILRFLYRTAVGRMVLKLLIQPEVSKAAGCILSAPVSKWLVPYYIRKHKIDMSDIDVPQGGFPSFNAFFTRKRKEEHLEPAEEQLISPCDGFLTPLRIRKGTVLDIKNAQYSLEDLLKDCELAAGFEGGWALVFRLTPANYHRYCYASDGRILKRRKIQGKLHCVRPIALRTLPVFVHNSREYQVLRTDRFGTVIQMEVGALLVGKIKNHSLPLKTRDVRAGEEKGYFEFGGSTIILLLKKDAVCMNEKLYERRDSNGEIPVRMGEFVAIEKKKQKN